MRLLLYLNCWLTDLAGFMVIFAVSRGLAEQKAPQWYLGIVGAGLSFSAGLGSILGGWLAHKCDGRKVFVGGAALMVFSIIACWIGDPRSSWFLPLYWLLGIGIGCLYPPLVGWLNQGEISHAQSHSVSRTLILYCISWNFGMLCGQLTAGELFAHGAVWTYGAALFAGVANLVVALCAARLVPSAPASPEESIKLPVTRESQLATSFKRIGWIANLGGMFGGSMVVHLLPDLAVNIGIHADRHGQLLAGWRVSIIAAYLLLHASHFWHFQFKVSALSQLLAAGGLLVIAQSNSAVMLLGGLVLLGQMVGYNYFSGLFYSTIGSSDENRALAAGIHEATLATGMAVGTVVGGFLGYNVNFRVPYQFAAGVLVVLVAVQVVAWWKWVRPLQAEGIKLNEVADVARLD
ncbi:MAG: MFS transporter [Planctomycetaceae bacterium]